MTEERWVRRPEGSNWGDFGPDDQIGRMNLLTPERRLRAIREVTHGQTFTLSLPLDYPGGNALFEYRKEPRFFHERRGPGHNYNFRLSNVCGCFSDIVSDDAVLLYTQYSTQWDGLSHVGQLFDADGDGMVEKVYYNGYRGG
ncbi:MAG TPA: cyclase family protein, partial [Microvirga sp.]|nr:cyclase family protein [Microvirga sp.]